MQYIEENCFEVVSLYIISDFIFKFGSSTENIHKVYK